MMMQKPVQDEEQAQAARTPLARQEEQAKQAAQEHVRMLLGSCLASCGRAAGAMAISAGINFRAMPHIEWSSWPAWS